MKGTLYQQWSKRLSERGVTISEAQQLVHELEDAKGFHHELEKKILWMTEELGELVHAYKHNDKVKLAEEAIDVFFFVVSILAILDVDGDGEFLAKLEKNWNREPVNSNGEFHFDRK
jgi:NTP pyrophosphatase (non-canonical NTP hydrolase)